MNFKRYFTIFLICLFTAVSTTSYANPALVLGGIVFTVEIAKIVFTSPAGKRILKKIGKQLFGADDYEIDNDGNVIFIVKSDRDCFSANYSEIRGNNPDLIIRQACAKLWKKDDITAKLQKVYDNAYAEYEFVLNYEFTCFTDGDKSLGNFVVYCPYDNKKHKVDKDDVLKEIKKYADDGDKDAKEILDEIERNSKKDDDDGNSSSKDTGGSDDDDDDGGKICKSNPKIKANDPNCKDGDDGGDFCTKYAVICDWFMSEPNLTDDRPLEHKKVELQRPDTFDKDYVSVNAQCPADVVRDIPIGPSTFKLTFEMSPICDFASNYLRPVLIFMAYIYGALMIGGALRFD